MGSLLPFNKVIKQAAAAQQACDSAPWGTAVSGGHSRKSLGDLSSVELEEVWVCFSWLTRAQPLSNPSVLHSFRNQGGRAGTWLKEEGHWASVGG